MLPKASNDIAIVNCQFGCLNTNMQMAEGDAASIRTSENTMSAI